MKLQVLILTQSKRFEMLKQLLSILKPQCNGQDAGFMIRVSDPVLSLGENREIMRQQSTGEYIVFVDDDDFVAHDYVSKVLSATENNVDYIGYRLQQYCDGQKDKPTFNRLIYKNWFEDKTGYYRDISHICPMRRELAIQVSMEGGRGEDDRWARGIRDLGIVKTEHYIDEVMYIYLWRKYKRDKIDHKEPYRREMLFQLQRSLQHNVKKHSARVQVASGSVAS